MRDTLAFRGGTALYKLYLKPAARYSEDFDLVQIKAEPAGDMMGALRGVLDPWLGTPRWKQTEGRVTFSYRFESEDPTPVTLRLKVEVNTREHFAVYGFQQEPFTVASRWFDGAADITTYNLSMNCWARSSVRSTSVVRDAIFSTWRLRCPKVALIRAGQPTG